MPDTIRIGAVSYLNTRPLVWGLERPVEGAPIELTFATPAELAEAMAGGRLDMALLPVIELARLPHLEVVPGLGIVTHGASRSVLLVSKRPVESVETVALDPESRTSNALVRVLFAEVWERRPSFETGPTDLDRALGSFDAAVRIGDKALFEPGPPGTHIYDLGQVWTDRTGLPFVYAAWFARPGVVDPPLYRRLHASRREGARSIREIAAQYTWHGRAYPELAETYLTHHIRFRLGSTEITAMRAFFAAAARIGLIDAKPEIRLVGERWTECHEAAALRGMLTNPAR
jgi:predicted solute-binding protein